RRHSRFSRDWSSGVCSSDLTPEGFLLSLRVTPDAGRDAIDGVESRDDGSTVLRVRVNAVPDKGKANAAVIALLAKTLSVPKSSRSEERRVGKERGTGRVTEL